MNSLRLQTLHRISVRSFSSAAKPRVGFIGLGNMGGHMASNLLKKGYQVTVFDLNPSSVQRLASQGAAASASIPELASKSEALITMLPSSPHVKEVYAGGKGVFSAAPANCLLLDCSTIDPTVSKQVASEAQSRGFRMLDAPVSGGVGGAEAGTLTFMVGGDKNNFDTALPILQAMGKNIVHCGPSGMGQVAKVCNNLVLGISMAGVAEAMALGVNQGIDPSTLASIINTSSGRCWSSDTYNPCPGVMNNVPSSRNYTGGFATDLMAKDLGLAVDAARSVKGPLPMGTAALALYQLLSSNGGGHLDFSAVYQLLKGNLSKVEKK